MKYEGRALGSDLTLAIGDEGIKIGSRYLDYSEVWSISPVSHRVLIDTMSGEQIEISMLGYSFDGFWEELLDRFGKRSLEALFVDEELIMLVEGEYQLPAESGDQMRVATESLSGGEQRRLSGERGRARIALYPDSVCILPQTCRAVRIPLCFADSIWQEGYQLHITMRSGEEYVVGKMGYDTEAFVERTVNATDTVKKQRAKTLEQIPLSDGFSAKGLFRTEKSDQYWNAALGNGICALELFTGEDAATYLYRFSEPTEQFCIMLEEALEAMGTHREIVYLTEEQLQDKPLYRMAVDRMKAVRFLRGRSAGRIIHNSAHDQKLKEFLGSDSD